MAKSLQKIDAFGFPMLLNPPYDVTNERNENSTTSQYFISDCGSNLLCRPSRNTPDIITLCVICLLITLPEVHCDCHLRNICVRDHNIQFEYTWTIRIGVHIFEFSWKCFGVYSLIDWDSVSSSSTCHAKPISPCGTRLMSGFDIPFIDNMQEFEGHYPGIGGIVLLLKKIKGFSWLGFV